MRFRFLLCLVALLSAGLRLSVGGVEAGNSGWEHLDANRNPAARAAFQAALKRDPNDAEALRGLATVDLLEDNRAGAAASLRALYRRPQHWMARASWPQFIQAVDECGKFALLEAAARDILAAKEVPSDLRASARLVLATAADRAGKKAEGDKTLAALAYVRSWQVVGPLENVSRSGLNKVFGPEKSLDLKASVPSRDGLPLPWRRLAMVSRPGVCQVSEALNDEGDAVFYAATALESPAAQDAIIHYNPSGAGKVFLNGEQVFADERDRLRRDYVADAFALPVKLRAGWNTVLVKLAQTGYVHSEFTLRLTDAAGKDLPLKADPTQASGSCKAVSASGAPDSAAAEAVRKEVAPLSLQAAEAIATLRSDHGDYEGATEMLRLALAKAPQSGRLQWALSRVVGLDGQVEESTELRESARKLNPRLIEVELAHLEDGSSELQPAEKIAKTRALLKINPNSAAVYRALTLTYLMAGLEKESTAAEQKAHALAPSIESWSRQIEGFIDENKMPKAEAAMAQALKLHPNDYGLLLTKTTLLEEKGQFAPALAIYDQVRALNGPHPNMCQAMATTFEAAGNRAKAIQSLQQARTLAPQNTFACIRLADKLRESGSTAKAIPLYQEAIRLAPARIDLREKLQLLKGEKPVHELAPAAPVPALPKTLKPGEGADAGAIALMDESRIVVYPDYASEAKVHVVIRVLDDSGVRTFQSFPLERPTSTSTVAIEKAQVTKADGKKQDANRGFGEDEGGITFPSLAPGDTIDVSYRVQDFPRGGLAKQHWGQWYFGVGTFPTKVSRFVLITPPDIQFRTATQGGVPAPTERRSGAWKITEWRATDLPARKIEQMGLTRREVGPALDYSTIRSWAEIVSWYTDLSESRCHPDSNIRAKAAELTKGLSTDEERIRALFRFISDGLQYQTTPFRLSAFVPTEGKQVLRERYGDCKDKSALLCAMLESIGIRARMALVNTRDEGTLPYLPSPRFNHAIAVITTAKGPLWVDATAENCEFSYLPMSDQGVPALIIDPATTDLALTPEMPNERNLLTDTHAGVLHPDGKLAGEMTLEASGNWGWILRSSLKQVPEANRDMFYRSLIGTIAENARLVSGSIEGLAEPEKPLRIKVKYEADKYATNAGQLTLMRLPSGTARGGNIGELILRDGTRTEPADISSLKGQYVSHYAIEIPKGWTLQGLDPKVSLSSRHGSLDVDYRSVGASLTVRKNMSFTGMRVSTSELKDFAMFLSALQEENQRQFVLKKP